MCGIRASSVIPILRLSDEGAVVFEGCVWCLDTRVQGLPEAKVLLRVTLMVTRETFPGREVGTA